MKTVIKDPYFALNSVDYSAQIESIELPEEADEVDQTNGGSGGNREVDQGIRRATLTVNLKLDADMALVTVLENAYRSATPTLPFEVRRSQAAVGATNPKWTGTLVVTQAGISLQVGQGFNRSLSLPVTGAVAFATS